MRRRDFVWLLGGAVGWPRAVDAQPTRKVYRIGMLSVGATTSEMTGPHPLAPPAKALLRGLRDLGYVYGEHFVTEARSAEGQVERFARIATELASLDVDVIVAAGPLLAALKEATSTIPVVMAGAEDPVGIGVVRSLAQPGGNFTGLSNQSVELTVKRLELLKELVPGPTAVAILWDPAALPSWQAAETAGQQRGWKLLSFEVRDAREIESVIKAAADARAGALLAVGGLAFRHARHIAEVANRNRLPSSHTSRMQVGTDGLISYGADLNVIWRRAAFFIDKILKGGKPADIPVEQPTKFELVMNLRMAKALGLAVPPSLLVRADEVIE